jgi:hypothetical protein
MATEHMIRSERGAGLTFVVDFAVSSGEAWIFNARLWLLSDHLEEFQKLLSFQRKLVIRHLRVTESAAENAEKLEKLVHPCRAMVKLGRRRVDGQLGV